MPVVLSGKEKERSLKVIRKIEIKIK